MSFVFRKLSGRGFLMLVKGGDVAAGLPWIFSGMLMIAFLFRVATIPAHDLFRVVSLFIVVEGYSIVAMLLITMGLRRMLGPQSRFDNYLEGSWRRVLAFAVGSSLIVAGCWLIAVLTGRG